MTTGVDLAHWHRVGNESSAFVHPPACCQSMAEKRLVETRQRANEERRKAVHEERRRVVKESIATARRYEDALASVLVGDQAELATKVMAHVVEAIRSVGCVCPTLETTSLGDAEPRYVASRDPDCGVH